MSPTRRSWRQRLLRWFGGRAALERDLIYQLAPGLQGIVAPDGTLRRVGAGWLAVLGYDPASLPGRNITEFLHPADVEPTRAAVIRALAGAPAGAPFVNRYRCADGRYRWIQWYTRPLGDSGELYGFGLDITELTEAQERFRSAFEHAAVGMSLVALPTRSTSATSPGPGAWCGSS